MAAPKVFKAPTGPSGGYAPGGVSYFKPKAPPKMVTAPTYGYAPGGVPTRVPGQKPLPGVSYAPIPKKQQVGAGGAGAPTPSTPGLGVPGYFGPQTVNIAGTGHAAYTPNYGLLLRNDPGYKAAQVAAQADEGNAMLQRRGDIRQALIQYGGPLTGWTDTYGDIDQTTRDLAAANQFSTLAGLARQNTQSNLQLRQSLAARGALQSGELGYGLDQLNTQYGQQRYDAGNALGQQLNQSVNAYTGVLDQNRANLVNALQTAESSIYSNPMYQPVAYQAPSQATYDAGESARRGKAVYGSGGTYYDANGNPL